MPPVTRHQEDYSCGGAGICAWACILILSISEASNAITALISCTSRSNLMLTSGDDLVLVIDVQGARQVRASGVATTTIFVLPPSAEILEQRLRGRSRDSEDAIRRRLTVARDEVSDVGAYDYVVVNDDLEAAVGRLTAIVKAERARSDRMWPVADRIVRTFGQP